MANKKTEPSYVTVEIYNQSYHLSGQDMDQVRRLAARVDERMRAVAAHGSTVDSLRVAVLAALNLADALTRAEEKVSRLERSHLPAASETAITPSALQARIAGLSGLLDSVLQEDRKTGS